MNDIDPDEQWLTERTEEQSQEDSEIVMMINRVHAHNIAIQYAFRGYDNKHLLEVEGTKCYGQSPKVHAFLSGVLVGAEALIFRGRTMADVKKS